VFSVFGEGGGDLLSRGGQDGDRGQQGVGSGFVLDGDGEVATNAHVVTNGEGASIKPADTVFVQFADRNQVEARIVGFDPNSDVALLKIDPAGLRLRPLRLGATDDVEVGQPVAAIGSPYGEPQSLSVGVVSAKDRSIESLTGFTIPGALQTDAAVNRGNSGGPLVDAGGRVLGINSQIRSTGGGGEGVGFAVSVDTVKRVLRDLRASGRVDYSFLGVETAPVYPQLATKFELGTTRGAWVQQLTDDGPADDAGLRGGGKTERFQARPYRTGGDVITRVAGRPIRGPEELAEELARFGPGRTITLQVFRDGRPRDLRVKLGKRPEKTG
jgi:2-alkenal reductase